MRIRSLSKVYRFPLLVLILFSGACGSKPEKPRVDAQLSPGGSEKSAIWFTGSNYSSGGNLGRFDLRTGKIDPKVLAIGSDAVVFEDGKEGILLLERMISDSLSRFTGADAKPSGSFALPVGSNPQGVARDQKGRVWVTFQRTDVVKVIDESLKAEVASIDVSTLREESSEDGSAEFAQIIALPSGEMVATAQRLQQKSSYWKPSEKSGLAFMNPESLALERVAYAAAPNPVGIFADGSGGFSVVGAGDLGSQSGLAAAIARFPKGSAVVAEAREPSDRILWADLSDQGDPSEDVLIVWKPAQSKSCILYGGRELACEGNEENGGYTFSRVLRDGKKIVAAYGDGRRSQLWVVPTDGGEIERADVPLPITSLSFGP